MNVKNVELKANVDEIDTYEQKLLKLNPDYRGTDHQIDTYFNAKKGRLKLREGNIENALINYDRDDVAASRLSEIMLYKHKPDSALRDILAAQLGIKVVVNKTRKIYFIDNVKFHFDVVKRLGTFIEVEAIDRDNEFTIDELKTQCNKYFDYFSLSKDQLIDRSYSDLVLAPVSHQ